MRRALLLLPLLAASSPGLTVVRTPIGQAAHWLVDGQPVPARVFWGAPGPANLAIGPEAQTLAYEFTSAGAASNGTLHFRFGRQPGQIDLDDVSVTDLDTGQELLPRADFEPGTASFQRDWTSWPRDAANTVGQVAVTGQAGRDGSAGLRVTLREPPGGAWPDFHIYLQPRLTFVEGHRYRVRFWVRSDQPRALTTACYRPGQPFACLGGPADAFAAQITLAARAGVRFVSFPIPLPWPEPGQAAEWDAVDAACRRVLAVNPAALLLPRVPMDPPPWWRTAHPDEVMQWEDGRRDGAVPASPVYRRDAAARLAALVAHLEEHFGEQVAGYHPCGQNTGEWFYEGAWKSPLSGYAPADQAAWRAWLGRRYGSDEALRDAWRDPAATRAAAEVPSPAVRRAAPAGVLRDPQAERALLDWADFQQEAMADCVIGFARVVRQGTQGRKLVLFFYGYTFELAGLHNGAAVSGHGALRRVLDSPDIDVLCAPISYFDRGLGGYAAPMGPAESVALAGKMWLNEDDTHTHLATEDPPGFRDHVTCLEDTNRELARNVAQAALRNFGTWWMDLCGSGWFNDARMWDLLTRLQPLDAAEARGPFRPEIAAVVDERALLRVTPAGAATAWAGIYASRRALGRVGAPFGQYLLDDVLAGRVDAKLYVLLNPWDLDVAGRARLQTQTRGAALVWCFPPGTGAGPTNGLTQAEAGLSFVHREAALTTTYLRDAASRAGVHLFTTTDCNVYARGGFEVLHAAAVGPVVLDTGRPGAVEDVLSGERLGRGPRVQVPLAHGDTRVLRIDTP